MVILRKRHYIAVAFILRVAKREVAKRLSQNGHGYMMLEPKWQWIHMVNTMHTGKYIIHI